MKKTKQPGENISLKTKKTEDALVMQWLNAQTNLMDSLRYLMEKEISENGVRNLQAFIPVERNMLGGSPGAVMPAESAGTPVYAGQSETAAAAEAPASLPAAVQKPAPTPVEEEELDDDDIEAWI